MTCACCCAWAQGRAPSPTAVILDSRTLQSTPESGAPGRLRRGQAQEGVARSMSRSTRSATCWRCTSPRPMSRTAARSRGLAEAVQAATGETVELAFVDQGYTGEPRPATAAAGHGIRLEVVKLPAAKRGFVLLPRRWVVERSFAWTGRFRPPGARLRAVADDPGGLSLRRLCLARPQNRPPDPGRPVRKSITASRGCLKRDWNRITSPYSKKFEPFPRPK